VFTELLLAAIVGDERHSTRAVGSHLLGDLAGLHQGHDVLLAEEIEHRARDCQAEQRSGFGPDVEELAGRGSVRPRDDVGAEELQLQVVLHRLDLVRRRLPAAHERLTGTEMHDDTRRH
jgi:hypothetical protein